MGGVKRIVLPYKPRDQFLAYHQRQHRFAVIVAHRRGGETVARVKHKNDGVTLDEYADMRPSVWGEVIRPMLADRGGWATFIGTPKGRNEFCTLWERARTDDKWFALMLRASETGILPADELSQAAADMTPEQYAQEFECSLTAAIIGAYFGKEIAELERNGHIAAVAYDPLLPVHTAWDLGIGDSTVIWFFQVAPGELRVIDYYENHGQQLRHYVAEINARGYAQGI